MPSIQSSLLPFVESCARLVSEVPSFPYEKKNDPRNGIPIHLTVSDFTNDLAPLAWVSQDYDKAWDEEWIKMTEYPLLRYVDKETGKACRYFGQATLEQGSPALTKAMWPESVQTCMLSMELAVVKPELQAVFADPRSSYFTSEHKPQLDNRVLDLPRKQVSEMGFPFYGVLMIAHTKSKTEDLKLWIAKRSEDKVFRPGLWDITVCGGIPAGLSVRQGLEKEAAEEAGMSPDLLKSARSGGFSSYLSEDGIIEYEHLYDLEVEEDYRPTPTDGEVEFFRLVPASQVLFEIQSDPSQWAYWSILLIIDFLIRHGIINRDNEPHLGKVVGRLHQDTTFVARSVRLEQHLKEMRGDVAKDKVEPQNEVEKQSVLEIETVQ